jgi:hypothetical protein
MNKYQEALWKIKEMNIMKLRHVDYLVVMPYQDLLQELVDRSIPKKPIKVYYNLELINYECPHCSELLGFKSLSKTYINVCRKCGQAMDWRTNE